MSCGVGLGSSQSKPHDPDWHCWICHWPGTPYRRSFSSLCKGPPGDPHSGHDGTCSVSKWHSPGISACNGWAGGVDICFLKACVSRLCGILARMGVEPLCDTSNKKAIVTLGRFATSNAVRAASLGCRADHGRNGYPAGVLVEPASSWLQWCGRSCRIGSCQSWRVFHACRATENEVRSLGYNCSAFGKLIIDLRLADCDAWGRLRPVLMWVVV